MVAVAMYSVHVCLSHPIILSSCFDKQLTNSIDQQCCTVVQYCLTLTIMYTYIHFNSLLVFAFQSQVNTIFIYENEKIRPREIHLNQGRISDNI